MSWNYRAVRKTFDYDGHEEIGIYSVYYDDKGEVHGMSLLPAHVNSYSLEEVEDELDLMKECLQKPILDYNDAPVTPDKFMRMKIERVELVDGVIVELPHRMFTEGVLIGKIGEALQNFVQQHALGQVAAGGSFLTGINNVRVPDVSFISNQDLEGENTDEIIQKAPTLAVEIISKNDTYGDVDDKADEFLAAGTQMVWIVNPRRRTVAVHTPDALPQLHNIGDLISGGAVLPGFELPVAEIFAD